MPSGTAALPLCMAFHPRGELALHEGAIKALEPSGGALLTGGADGIVLLTGLDGQEVASSGDLPDIVNAVRAASSGRVAIASRDGRVRVWDPGSGAPRVVGQHDHWVSSVAWDDDGERLASVSEDGTLRLWDTGGGGELARLDLRYPSSDLDWRGDTIAVASGDKKLYLVDAERTAVAREIEGAGQMLWSVRFSPDATMLAWSSRDRTVRLSTPAGEPVVLAGGHGAQVWAVGWHPSGNRLASAAADGTVAIWSAAGDLLERLLVPGWARAARWVGDRLAVACEDGGVRVFADDDVAARPPEPTLARQPPQACTHIDPVVTTTDETRCRTCSATAELRLCLTCGHVGCCESQLAHATRHWEETGHPNTTPVPVRELGWRWCYDCDTYVKRVAAAV